VLISNYRCGQVIDDTALNPKGLSVKPLKPPGPLPMSLRSGTP
jgi:hypothetical protein